MRGTIVKGDVFGLGFAAVAFLCARSHAQGMKKSIIREGQVIAGFALLLLAILSVDLVRAYQRQREETRATSTRTATTHTNLAPLWLYKPETNAK